MALETREITVVVHVLAQTTDEGEKAIDEALMAHGSVLGYEVVANVSDTDADTQDGAPAEA